LQRDSEEAKAMKLSFRALATAFAVSAVVGLGAQTSQTETRSSVTVKDGTSVKVTGCVAQTPDSKFVLTNVADKTGALHDYMLVSGDNLAEHVGHRVRIEGKVTDRGDGKVEIETKSKTFGHGDDNETKSKSEIEGVGPAFLGVHSLKMIAASCP
jgi:hypothetical protein